MKTHLTACIALALISITQVVSAASLKPPSLLEPSKNDFFQIKKPIVFRWQKSTNATKYRLIISSNSKFGNYEPKGTGKCNTTFKTQKCFFTTTQSTNFTLPAKNPLLQTQGSYFWQVQALSATNSSIVYNGSNLDKSGEVRPFTVSETLAIPKFVNNSIVVEPKTAAAGSTLNFSVQLTTELPDGYVVNIDFGDGELNKMTGSGVDYAYSTPWDTVGEDQSFTVSITDKNSELVDTNGDSFTITAADDVTPSPVVVETPVVKPKPVVTPPKTVTIPSVSNPLASPSATTQGNALTFSATLSANLPDGYNVKVNYGNGLIAMSGSGKNYSVSQTPLTLGLQTFTVGIYDNLDLLKSNAPTGTFEIVKPNTAPTLTLSGGATTATLGSAYTVKLSANDSDNNLNVIKMDWGDGATESQAATNGATLTFSHTYASEKSFTWKAIAYDSSNATSSAVSKKVAVSKPAPVPAKTTGYSKIANNGDVLSDDAKLGTAPTDWACTKDNKTGLIWEVKTDDGGLRDMNKTYTNYTADYPKCGWSGCEKDFPSKFGDSTNTDGFVTAVNAQGLCGKNDWRLPTNEELRALVVCSDGKYNTLGKEDYGYICKSNESTLTTTTPTINTTYFPDIKDNYWFWSSSPYADSSNYAWIVYFYNGNSDGGNKSNYGSVRLVR